MIFAVTHIGKFDYQIVTEVLKVYQIPFSGDPEKMYRTFEGFILWLNGVIYCDTDNRGDRKVGYHTMVNTLRAGKELESFWSNNVDALMAEVPYYDYELERHTKYCEKGVVQAEEAYSFFGKSSLQKPQLFCFEIMRDSGDEWREDDYEEFMIAIETLLPNLV